MEEDGTGFGDDLTGPSFTMDPHPSLHRLRATDPVHRTGSGEWILTRYADVVAALHDPKLHTGWGTADETRAIYGQGPLTDYLTRRLSRYDPPDHTRLRSLVARPFTPRRIASLRAHTAQLAARLLGRVKDESRFDFIRAIAHPLPSLVISELIGIPEADRGQHTVWTAALQTAMAKPSVAQAREEGEAAAAAQYNYLEDLARERHHEPRDDLTSALLFAEEQGQRLSHEEVVATLMFLFAAGHSTTRDLLGSGLVAMLAHRDQFARVSADLALAPSAVEECLRFDSPITMLRRRAVAGTTIAGRHVRAGEHIVAVLLAANRDPERFPDPDRFLVDRLDNSPVAFGGGIHFCVGAALARMEAQVVVSAVAREMPDLVLADGSIHWRETPVFRGPISVHVGRG
jgi:cytochrome P450